MHIALLMMMKNEKKRILVTLESVKDYVDSLVLYDTGSTDNTIDIVKEFSEKYNIPLRLKTGEFVDFSTSRNVSLEFADTFDDIDYLLLMDVNDELKNGDGLIQFAKDNIDSSSTGFLLCQEWFCGSYDKYYNMRFIKPRSGWRFRGSVHEYLKNTSVESDDLAPPVVRIPDNIILFQDRTQDDDKSRKRFSRDKVLLLNDFENDPTEPRTVFYLAQTCGCLQQFDEAFKYYKIRSELLGFWEEKFHSYLRAGDMAMALKHPWHDAFVWYMKAYEHTPRAEPLVKIADYYKECKNWILAYTFINLACLLTYPDHCILFVDKNIYDYQRWHLLGIIGWYAKFYNEGKIGCIKAIESGKAQNVDFSNLKFYEDREKENKIINPYQTSTPQQPTPLQPTLTNSPSLSPSKNHTIDEEDKLRFKFLQENVSKLSEKYPGLPRKKILNKINKLWKESNNK